MLPQAEKTATVVPGWEDSTMGNIFYPMLKGELKPVLREWVLSILIFLPIGVTNNSGNGIGFFQIG